MKERPLLFSASMVLALLAGRKTQTRRLAKVRKHPDFFCEMTPGELWHEEQSVIERACPYGAPGDRIWVKETHRFLRESFGLMEPQTSVSCQYRASEHVCDWSYWKVVASATQDTLPNGWSKMDRRIGQMRGFTIPKPVAWRPSIFMSRWASRLTLELTAVRLERLQDISEADAIAEGIPAVSLHDLDADSIAPSAHYRALWEQINGARSWAKNPWVWVLTFRKVTP
jgi:hypothetical protein